MSINPVDKVFKTLSFRETTDSTGKYTFNELGADTINVHADTIWADTIPYDDPAGAVSAGVAELWTLLVLTEDPTVSGSQAWKAVSPPGNINNTRLRDWISPKFGETYRVRLFDNSGQEMFPTHASGWQFDCQTGVLTFNGDVSVLPKPFKITGYRYVGIKGALTLNSKARDIPILIHGGGSTVTAQTIPIFVPWDCTVTGWQIIADNSGSIVVDIQKCSYNDFPTAVSIAGSEKPTLTSEQKNEDLTLTTWSPQLTKGDILMFSVEPTPSVVKIVNVRIICVLT